MAARDEEVVCNFRISCCSLVQLHDEYIDFAPKAAGSDTATDRSS